VNILVLHLLLRLCDNKRQQLHFNDVPACNMRDTLNIGGETESNHHSGASKPSLSFQKKKEILELIRALQTRCRLIPKFA
jgi:hypothetical protein